MQRQLKDRIETYDEIIEGECSCGTRVIMVLGSSCTTWKDGKRYHYPEDNEAYCIFRCKKCIKPIKETFIPLIELKNI